MSQNSGPVDVTNPSAPQNDSSLIGIGAQFDDIPAECYAGDIVPDIPAGDEEKCRDPVPVSWERDSR